ncbi:MAG: hypothetical protein ACYDCD_09600, partial [Candidatus Acidiferrales bacterium]
MRRLVLGFVAMALMSAAPAFATSDGDKGTDTSANSGNTSSAIALGSRTKKKAAAAKDESSSSKKTSTTGSATAAAPPSATASASTAVASPKAAQTGEPNQSPLFFRIGGANFTPLGFLDFTSVYRSTNVGSGIGT